MTLSHILVKRADTNWMSRNAHDLNEQPSLLAELHAAHPEETQIVLAWNELEAEPDPIDRNNRVFEELSAATLLQRLIDAGSITIRQGSDLGDLIAEFLRR